LTDLKASRPAAVTHHKHRESIPISCLKSKSEKSLNFIFGIKMAPLSEQEMKKWRVVAGLNIILGSIVANVQV
jgi:hypothetical protein